MHPHMQMHMHMHMQHATCNMHMQHAHHMHMYTCTANDFQQFHIPRAFSNRYRPAAGNILKQLCATAVLS